MIVVSERRVLSALLTERGASLGARVRAAGLAAAGPLWRATRRAGFVLAAAAAFVLVPPAVLAVELLIKAL